MDMRKRDHNLASVIEKILKLGEYENPKSLELDDKGYKLTTETVYEGNMYGPSRDRVTFSPGLKVWHAIDQLHAAKDEN